MRAAHDAQVMPATGRSQRSSWTLGASVRHVLVVYPPRVSRTPTGGRGMAVRGYSLEKDDYRKRLRRIEGQVRGLQRMIDDDEYCIDVLTQIVSVTKALQGVGPRPARRARPPLRARRRRGRPRRGRRQDRRGGAGGRAPPPGLSVGLRGAVRPSRPSYARALRPERVELASRQRRAPPNARATAATARTTTPTSATVLLVSMSSSEPLSCRPAPEYAKRSERDQPRGPPPADQPRSASRSRHVGSPRGVSRRRRPARGPGRSAPGSRGWRTG